MIVRETLRNQLKDRNLDQIDEMESTLSLEELQKLMVDSVSDNVKKKELEEMKKMSEQIWNERNKFKAEPKFKATLAVSDKISPAVPNRMAILISGQIKANLEDKKIEESISKKKKYLSRKTKEIVKTIPEFMLSFNDSKRVQWDICVILMTIFNCFYIPFNIAFEPSIYYELEIFNSLIDFIFYLDIILNLRTTYMTKNGEEIMNQR